MRRSSILLLVAIITVTPMAFANPPSEGGQDIKSFAQLDKNQDGQLTKAELPASTMHSQHFAKIDSDRSEEHTSELQSLMRISYAVFCWKKKNSNNINN